MAKPMPPDETTRQTRSAPRRLILLSTGSNAQNQLAHSHLEDSHRFLRTTYTPSSDTPLLSPDSASPLVAADRSGSSSASTAFPPPDCRSVLSLAFGANHTIALSESSNLTRHLWGTGDGSFGQLGILPDRVSSGNGTTGHQGFRKLELPEFPSLSILISASSPDFDQAQPSELVSVQDLYRPSQVACSWTTSYITFHPHLPNSPSVPSSHPLSGLSETRSTYPYKSIFSRLPPLLLAMGSNDFSELGNGLRGTSTSTHHWHVFSPDDKISRLWTGMRHILVEVSSQVRDGLGGRTTSMGDGKVRLLGWGAARHGQLGHDDSSITQQPTRPGTVVEVNGQDLSKSRTDRRLTSKIPAVVSSPRPLTLPEGSILLKAALGMNHSLLLVRHASSVSSTMGASSLTCHGSPIQTTSIIPLGRPTNTALHIDPASFPSSSPPIASQPLSQPSGSSKQSEHIDSSGPNMIDIASTWASTFVLTSSQPLLSSPSRPPSPPTLASSDLTPDPSSSSLCHHQIFSFGSNTKGQLARDPLARQRPPTSTLSASSSPSCFSSISSSPVPIDNLPRNAIIHDLCAGSEHVLVLLSQPPSPSPSSLQPPPPPPPPHLPTKEPPPPPSPQLPTYPDPNVKKANAKPTKELWAWGWNEHGNLGWAPPPSPSPPSESDPEEEEAQWEWRPRRVEIQRDGEGEGLIGGDEGKGKWEVVKIWAGMGTSWVLMQEDEEELEDEDEGV